MKKILISLIIAIFVLTVGYSMIYSSFAADGNFDLTAHEADAEGKAGYSETKTAIGKLTGTILAAFRYAGAGIALISIVLIGAKYLYDSPGEKADYKKNLLVYTIGGVGMFSVATILSIIQEFSGQIETGSGE